MRRKDRPASMEAFAKHRESFTAFLLARGSAIMEPTNPYEVMRFVTDVGVGIIHRNAADRLTSWQGGAYEAFHAFINGSEWRASIKTARDRRAGRRLIIVNTLAKRDGPNCIYCGCKLAPETATIEHVVSLTSGGPDHLANMALACKACNQEVGHMPAAQKILFAVTKRKEAEREEATEEA